MPDQLLTSDDVAERLQVTRQFVNRLRARWDLPAVKLLSLIHISEPTRRS